jgi:hypothetical protein
MSAVHYVVKFLHHIFFDFFIVFNYKIPF